MIPLWMLVPVAGAFSLMATAIYAAGYARGRRVTDDEFTGIWARIVARITEDGIKVTLPPGHQPDAVADMHAAGELDGIRQHEMAVEA